MQNCGTLEGRSYRYVRSHDLLKSKLAKAKSESQTYTQTAVLISLLTGMI